MPFEATHPIAPPLRGALPAELVRELALGELTHDQLAEKYERSPDAIKQFASRNKDEVRRTKQALIADASNEWVGVAIARKMDRIADADQDCEDLKELLQDPDLTPSQRRHYLALKDNLRHSVAEELGKFFWLCAGRPPMAWGRLGFVGSPSSTQ
jgi:hypothetical protein